MRVGRLAALLLAGVFVAGGCANNTGDRHPELVVGSRPDSESTLLAAIYVAALRSYGFGARGETGADPMAMLDSGGFTIVPGFTGKVLQILQPGAAVLSAVRVYRAMVSALPEGIAAGDYTTAAEDKPTLVVTSGTAKAWSGSDLSLVPSHCNGLVVGIVAGTHTPSAVGSCRLPAAREFPDYSTMFAALRAGQLTAGWTTTANPDLLADLIVLADGKVTLIQAENVVPLYRRNVLTDRQMLAINEVAGVLDTAALIEMRRQVARGADSQAIADRWLAEHPLGR
ncbi:glycine betaine ABC transporter substrate-binding protein [Mycobacterium lepromatosis]|uniref:Lipoprotein n=1 Tax=Mycobacterium lepromatosis TaxID=480418 RepID=A0A0F4ER71_9MYCO|nr:glycine betaine ABC transporter substrate-binding protein [Mycobacterium lepromatosis]KJX75284.1 lipoprotein [Mycobacterium lepromatosis]UKN42241.1 lipoprotein [Mycobacterium lepromatosis]